MSSNSLPDNSENFTPITPEEVPTSLAWQLVLEQVTRWRWIAFLSLALAACLATAIVIILPLKKTEIRYVEFRGDQERSFTVYPSDMPKEQRELLIRKALRQYVIDRHTVEPVALKERATRLKTMTTAKAFSYAKRQYQKIAERLGDGQREIEIVADFTINEESHQVEFITRDRSPAGDLLAEQSWIAQIRYRTDSQQNSGEQQLDNPLGILVSYYTLTPKPNQQTAAEANKTQDSSEQKNTNSEEK